MVPPCSNTANLAALPRGGYKPPTPRTGSACAFALS
jgi:hypothetical protein